MKTGKRKAIQSTDVEVEFRLPIAVGQGHGNVARRTARVAAGGQIQNVFGRSDARRSRQGQLRGRRDGVELEVPVTTNRRTRTDI